MSNEPRKATEVLLELESKLDVLLNIVRSQDLNIKVLSNKLNALISAKTVPQGAPTVEVADSKRIPGSPIQIPISAEDKIPVETSPQGFRRTSRPETYSQPVAKTKIAPKIPEAEAIVPEQVTTTSASKTKNSDKNPYVNSVPVQQRVVDQNGKSVFLADVEVIDIESGDKVAKTRTNGTGKWMAALAVGNYKVVLTKREVLTKERVELVQNIKVDGRTSPLELPTLIFK